MIKLRRGFSVFWAMLIIAQIGVLLAWQKKPPIWELEFRDPCQGWARACDRAANELAPKLTEARKLLGAEHQVTKQIERQTIVFRLRAARYRAKHTGDFEAVYDDGFEQVKDRMREAAEFMKYAKANLSRRAAP